MEPREKPKDPDDWRAFWRRNGRGVWKFWIDPANEHMICSTIVREENERDTGGRPIAINLPINGWFRRARIVCMDDRIRNLLQHWSARLHGIEHTDAILIELRYHDRGRKRHDCVVLDVGRALRVLEMATDKAHDPGLAGVIAHLGSALSCARRELDDAKQALEHERDHERGERELAQRMWRSALGVIETAILRIKDSSRFGASIEALKIRIFLLERFRDFMPASLPEEQRLREWCEWVRRELEAAHFDLDRRERHKARPSTGAGA